MCEHNHQVYNCVDCQEKKEQRDREQAIANGARYESTLRDMPGSGGLIEFVLVAIVELCDAIRRNSKNK